jgi:hypothetical protein
MDERLKLRMTALIVVLITLCLLLIAINIYLQTRYLYTYSLFWEEFDRNVTGLMRMLNLLTASNQEEWPSLVAAVEYALTIRAKLNKVELLLTWRGIKPQPLGGYLLSLTGGVVNAACQAHQSGYLDREWLKEIRIRIQRVHSTVNRDSVLGSKPQLQKSIDNLFTSESFSLYTDTYINYLPVTHMEDPFVFCP